MKNNIHYIGAFIFFFILSCFITYPLIFHLGSLVTGYGDELVISWIQNWVIHSLLSGNIVSIFTAPIYFPFHNSFAYSDTLLSSSVLALIPLLIFKQPIVTINFTFVTSLTLLGFSLYCLSYYLTRNTWVSFFSGVLVIFSPAVLDKAVHIQILSIWYVPFALLYFLKFMDKSKTTHLVLSLMFFVLQTYNSFVPGYFILFSWIIIFMYYYFAARKKIIKLVTPKHIVLLFGAFFLIIPLALPYLNVSKEYHYVRDFRDTIHFALQPEDFLYAGSTSRLHEILLKLPVKQTSVYQEVKPGFIGLTFSILSLFGLFVFFKNFKKNNKYINMFSLIGLVGLVLSLGPFLHINRFTIHHPFPIPLPYGLLYYIIPGFKGIRDTERWEMLFIIASAVVIALVLHQLLHRISKWKQLSIYILLIVCVIAEFAFPIKFYPVPQIKDFPKVYSWLATTPKDTKVIFLPIFNWNQFPYTQEEIWREYYSTIENRPMVNGYTGFSPDPWQALLADLWKNFPSDETISRLKNLGLSYVIVDKTFYDKLYKAHQQKLRGNDVIDLLMTNHNLKLMKVIGDEFVFVFQ